MYSPQPYSYDAATHQAARGAPRLARAAGPFFLSTCTAETPTRAQNRSSHPLPTQRSRTRRARHHHLQTQTNPVTENGPALSICLLLLPL